MKYLPLEPLLLNSIHTGQVQNEFRLDILSTSNFFFEYLRKKRGNFKPKYLILQFTQNKNKWTPRIPILNYLKVFLEQLIGTKPNLTEEIEVEGMVIVKTTKSGKITKAPDRYLQLAIYVKCSTSMILQILRK